VPKKHVQDLPMLNPSWVLMIGNYTDFVTGSFYYLKVLLNFSISSAHLFTSEP
jgi:hypothetical protein